MRPVNRAEWRGFRALVGEIGLWRSVAVAAGSQLRRWRGEPFGGLPPPDGEEERLSRAQAAPTILLYRQLLRQGEQRDRALRVVEAAVVAGAHAFLSRSIGRLRSAELAALDEPARRRFVEERGARFFNATIAWEEITPSLVRFTVTSCRFPRLCEAAGAPEIAPLFCRGDESFFGRIEPNVTLERGSTIAAGADRCRFALRWREG